MSFIEEQMNPNLISIKTKKHKSLGVLNLFFIKLFIQKGPLLSLDDAAESIFDEDGEGQEKFKSKVSETEPHPACSQDASTTLRTCSNRLVSSKSKRMISTRTSSCGLVRRVSISKDLPMQSPKETRN